MMQGMQGMQGMNEKDRELARLRKEKGLTQNELGQLAGTTGKYISDLEHGKPGGIEAMSKLARALDVPLELIWIKPYKQK